MSQSWNGKAIIDSLAARNWDTSTSFRVRLIEFINEIQDDIISEIPLEYFKFQLKRQLPVSQNIIDLSPDIPAKPVVSIGTASSVLNYNSTTSGNYTFDTDEIEFGATSGTLKALTGGISGITAHADYASDENMIWGQGTLTGVLVNGATVASGRLKLTPAGTKHATYTATNKINALKGAIRFIYRPNYTGNPASNVEVFAIQQASGDASFELSLRHDTVSAWRMDFRNTSGNLIAGGNLGMGSTAVTAGVNYELEFNWDFTVGVEAQRLFVDGALKGSQTRIDTRPDDLTTITYLELGGTVNTDHEMDDLVLFETVQHTAAYTAGSTITPIYSVANPIITLATALTIGELESFLESVTTPTNTSIKYILAVDGQDRYWDGAAWANSDGTFTQSNTVADINTNALALLSASSSIVVKVFLNNTSAQDRPEITSNTLRDTGSLIIGTSYHVHVSFLIYDDEQARFIESEVSPHSSVIIADANNRTILVSSIPVYPGTTTVSPNVIHRRLYLMKKASGETSFSDPLFEFDIEDNTTTTANITSESTSTITAPSDTEVDQVTSENFTFAAGTRWLVKESLSSIRRSGPSGNSTGSPSSFAWYGAMRIFIYPQLSATATTDQRTLIYSVYRRPHEIFYEANRKVDLPIVFKKALIAGVIWKSYEFRDRDGVQSKKNDFEAYKKQAIAKYKRQRGRPLPVRDTSGDTFGWEV